jgi:benzoyl-CoA reductase subunit C
MNQNIQEFARVVEQPYSWLASSKNGRRLIGCFPLYVPHELVDAAGMVPVNLYGASGEMNAAAAYLQTITCYPVRGATELLLTGQLDALDGAVFASVCTGATSGGEVWRSLNMLPYYHQLIVPRKARGESVVQFFKGQLARMQSSLEAFGGRPITNEALADSIKLYNRSRALLDKLAQVSSEHPDVLPPQDVAVVRSAASFMPRARYAELLSGLLSKLPSPSGKAGDRVRLVVTGNLCDLHQLGVFSLIDEAGGVVVEDDSPLGRRMQLPVAESGDPLEALARHYVEMYPCSTKCDDTLDANFDYLLGLVKSSQAQGVVFLRPLYCDPAGIDNPLLSNRLSAANIPTLSLDLNGREPATGQVLTRLQAFVEMLRR